MLIIRDAQLAALAKDRLIGRLARYAGDCFPEHSSRLGPEMLAEHIRRVVDGVESIHLCDEALYKYVSLAIVFGEDFESRPETSWAALYMQDREVVDPNERVRRLFAAMLMGLRIERQNCAALEGFYGA